MAAEARLLKLATWLSARGEPATRRQVYEAFPDDYAGSAQAKEKKWTRDKQDLRKLGIPVRFIEDEGPDGAYLVEATACTLPRIDLQPDEASAVWLAGQAALRTHDHPLADDLETALRKLAVGTKGLQPRAALLEAGWAVPEPARLRKWLDTLSDAIERRKQVKLAYRKSDGTVSERRLDPYGYAWRRGHWIVAGHCHLRGAVRVFYLERVRSLALAPVSAKGTDFEIPGDFDIRNWSRQETWDYFVHEPRAAAVRFRGSLAAVAPRLLPGARFTREPDNARLARLEVRNLAGLVRQALAWGPEAELVEPAEGRAMAREVLSGLAARLAGEGRP